MTFSFVNSALTLLIITLNILFAMTIIFRTKRRLIYLGVDSRPVFPPCGRIRFILTSWA